MADSLVDLLIDGVRGLINLVSTRPNMDIPTSSTNNNAIWLSSSTPDRQNAKANKIAPVSNYDHDLLHSHRVFIKKEIANKEKKIFWCN